MKRTLMTLLTLVVVAVVGTMITPTSAQAQCAKCVNDLAGDEGDEKCQFGPVSNPEGSTCTDSYNHVLWLPGTCMASGQCGWATLSELNLRPTGAVYALARTRELRPEGLAVLACDGRLIAMAYDEERERQVRTATDHLSI